MLTICAGCYWLEGPGASHLQASDFHPVQMHTRIHTHAYLLPTPVSVGAELISCTCNLSFCAGMISLQRADLAWLLPVAFSQVLEPLHGHQHQ